MVTIKSYTDLQQSKTLAGILPIKSADMICYGIHKGMDGYYHLSGENTEDDVIFIEKSACKRLFNSIDYELEYELPCWSLTALLDVLPITIGNILKKESMLLKMNKAEKYFNIWYVCIDTGFEVDGLSSIKNNAVDACYEMILKLHEQNLL